MSPPAISARTTARSGYLFAHPVRSLERIEHKHADGVAASPAKSEQIRAWFLERDRIGDAALVSVMAYGGLRTEEALAMVWRNQRARRYFVEQTNVNGELQDDPKTGHRWVELPEALYGDLVEWRLALGRPEGLIFPKPNGLPWLKSDRGNWRRRWFSKAASSVGLEGMTPRDLRHTCASLLAAVNTPRVEIEAQLGHRADTSERIYQHLIEDLRGRRLSLDELIAEARTEVFGDPDVRPAFGVRPG